MRSENSTKHSDLSSRGTPLRRVSTRVYLLHRLFAIEQKLSSFSTEEQDKQRPAQAKPVLDSFWVG